MTQLSLRPAIERVFPPFTELTEPLLAFGARTARRGLHVHPLIGLAEHGPYSLDLERATEPIRLGLIAPPGDLDLAERIAHELRSGHRPAERHAYLVDYPGFRDVFGLDITAPAPSVVALPADLDDRIQHGGDDPAEVVLDALAAALVDAHRRGGADVVVIGIPRRWDRWLTGDTSVVLHDRLKVAAASLGVSTQIVRERALGYPDRCSVAWRLAIAIYAKAGGIPWKLAGTTPDTMLVGIGYATHTSAGARFVIGAAHVFDERGAGLRFAGMTATEEDGTIFHGANPHLSRPRMHALLARALDAYQQAHSGRLPRRVAVHKSTRWQAAETEGAFDALGRVRDIDLLQIQASTPWRAVRGTATGTRPGQPDPWPVRRGTLLHLSDDELVLWTQGNTPGAAAVGTNYTQDTGGIPRPLLVRRFAGHASAEQVAGEVLALTKMDWNNDALHTRMPVTLSGAGALARTLGAGGGPADQVRACRWLL